MAKFEHKYGALTLQDDKGKWAEFTPAKRVVDGRDVAYGVLRTDDAKQIERLRAVIKSKKDTDLREVDDDEARNRDEVPSGTVTDVLDWVGDDSDRAQRALDAERTKGDRARSTLVSDLEQIAGR